MFKLITHSLIGKFINTGHPRSVKIKKNISASFLIKGFAIALSLVRVPILLSYLEPQKYGVWLTIASIIEWIRYFDFGLGSGLRNRFAEAIAKDDHIRARKLVSTSYISLTLIMAFILAITIPLVLFLNWNRILNIDTIAKTELSYSILLVLIIFIVRFVLLLISMILRADQKPAISDSFLPISNIISLGLILILKTFTKDSFFLACLIISLPPVLVLVGANYYFFKRKYNNLKPSLQFFDKSYLKDIYSLGIKFFIGQLGYLVLFSSSNFIISNIINPSEVTVFNIARKYFSLPIMFFLIIVTPYWSAITDAYARDEFNWIKSNMKKLQKLAFVFSFLIIIMLSLSNIAFKFWIGEAVIIPFKLSLIFAVYNITVIFLTPYTHFINGVGKLSLSIRIAIVKMFIFLPLAILLTQELGSFGLVVALIIANSLPNALVSTIQYSKIISRKAKGIWNR